jgi:hypothetical protein
MLFHYIHILACVCVCVSYISDYTCNYQSVLPVVDSKVINLCLLQILKEETI